MTTRAIIYRDNEDDDEEKRRIKDMLTAAIVSAAVGRRATIKPGKHRTK